jgi:hypothetical protein
MTVSVPASLPVGGSRTQDLGAVITFTADNTATTNSPIIDMCGCIGVVISVNITAITGTSPTLTVTIQAGDGASGLFPTVLQSAALATTGMTRLVVYPGNTVTGNISASTVMSQYLRVVAQIGGTTPAVTATIGVCLIN